MRIVQKSLAVVLLGALIVGLISTACAPSPTRPPEPTAAPAEPAAAPAAGVCPRQGGTLVIAQGLSPRGLNNGKLGHPGVQPVQICGPSCTARR